MPLPKLNHPIFETLLPISQQTVKYRPMLMGEQKIIMTMKNMKDEKALFESLIGVVSNCAVDMSPDDVADLPSVDFEWLFLQIRAKSVGEVVELRYTCKNKVKDDNGDLVECGNTVIAGLNIVNDVKVEFDQESKLIMIDDNIGIKMRLLNMREYNEILSTSEKLTEEEFGERIILKSIEMVFDQDKVYDDFSEQELKDFISELDLETTTKIEKFYQNYPALEATVELVCKKCGNKEVVHLRGLKDFLV